MSGLNKTILGSVYGDNSCHKKIYDMFYPTVWSVCSKYSRTNEETEDFIQESFIKVFQNISKFENSENMVGPRLGGWIKSISRNFCIDQVRKFKPTISENHQIINITQDSNSNEQTFSYNKEHIIKATEKLSPRYRDVFNMFYFDGLSHKEISEKLSINVGASKANLYCAKKRIKNIIIKNELDK